MSMSPVKSPVAVPAQPVSENTKLRQVAASFEAILVQQMISAMRQTVAHDGLMPQSNAEKIYEGMLDSEYANAMAQQGMLGLGDAIYKHLVASSGGQ